MTFQKAIKLLKEGEKIKRLDWDLSKNAYLELTTYNSKKNAYSIGKYMGYPELVEVYNFSFEDIEATDWQEITKEMK